MYMKGLQRIFILSFFILGSVKVNAQASATADIFATIVSPITIEKVAGKDLNFGNIAAGKFAGIVVLKTNGNRGISGGAVLPSTSGTASAAEFVVSGESSYSFSITLPTAPVTMVNTSTSETMVVDGFTSSPESTGTLSAGKQTVKIGARLNINANQSPGDYSSASPFVVTVNYN